ncbi:C1q-related factor-like [Sander lucioperca]|uniref:C1q-related factor-like n=1 Tax=Sander lucioperca TaxID=283035 RepID=UPI00165349D7|nr:C1q-related factor-like [Sander lucioperca]
MKISVSFTLLLLLGSVPASEGVECQRAFPEDIYAALRETTASLVQLKADVTLQTTEQAAQLKTEVDKLKQQQQEQAAQQKTEVDKLKQQQLVRQVAFSASLLVAGEATIGPFPTATPLIFKHVVTNIGNAYNSNSGVFTAPVRGAYYFEWTVGALGDNSYPSAAVLVKNSENVFMAFEQQAAGFMSSSKGVTLLLEVGDVVFVRLHGVAFDDYNHHTTFSGFLLFPM